MSALPDGWTEVDSAEFGALCEEPHLVIAMWVGPDDADLAVYLDGTVEVEKAAPIEIVTLALAAFHRHARAGTAVAG